MANHNYAADFLTNPGNLYYLHPSANPALVLVPSSLTGNNYHTWARGMSMALRSKNKLGFVDRSIVIPEENDPLFPAWQRYLQEDIYRLQQGEKPVTEFFTQIKTMWDELESLKPLPTCTCGAVQQVKTDCERDLVIRFLKGLNDQYAGVRSNIMMLDPFPDIDKAFSLVVQQERQFNTGVSFENASTVRAFNNFSNQSNYRSSLNRGRGQFNGGRGSGRGIRSQKICTHCGKSNHTIETCYQLHGFPHGYKSKGQANHISHESVHEFDDEFEANNSVHHHDEPQQMDLALIQEQYQKILGLLQQNGKSTNDIATSSNNFVKASSVANIDSSNKQINPTEYYQDDDWYS
ncbi:uncharacterized protein LOC133311050 [Gastrolobium bilobum]|uniref:uncharacterized protein LOC133311050 n=1 Tax=Gastrolobium bilobum TaxID=150636 RepID=UPI002AB05579|nr:uncharacterized protein LOC133311050 [Gastrolobium bilobum]